MAMGRAEWMGRATGHRLVGIREEKGVGDRGLGLRKVVEMGVVEKGRGRVV